MHQFIQLGWLRRDQFCSLKGIPKNTFKKLRVELHQTRKNYYCKKALDGCIWVHYERFDEWLEKNEHIKV